MEQHDNLFSTEDLTRLEDSYKYRKLIVEEAFREGKIPNSSKSIEAINSVLTAMDKSIYDRMNIKLKHQENQSREAILDMVSEALRHVSAKQQALPEPEIVDMLPDNLTTNELVPGELETNPQPISLDDIMQS